MRYIRLKALALLCLLVLLPLLVTGCVGVPPIAAPRTACAALLPEDWRRPVPGAPLPDADTVADWTAFGDAQTGQLDKANDRTISAIGIVERCEARDGEAMARATRPWWKFW